MPGMSEGHGSRKKTLKIQICDTKYQQGETKAPEVVAWEEERSLRKLLLSQKAGCRSTKTLNWHML